MGMADIAEVLWNDYLRHNPANPHWCDRDRFVLSNGHGSMLIYALAYLSGYPIEIDELRHFRQLGQVPVPGIHPRCGEHVADLVGLESAHRGITAITSTSNLRPGKPRAAAWQAVTAG